MQVMVARLDRTEVTVKEIDVHEGSTLLEAITQAGWSLGSNQKVAVWNVLANPMQQAEPGDRIEILPSLTVDPMTARRLREERNQNFDNRLKAGRNGGKHRLF